MNLHANLCSRVLKLSKWPTCSSLENASCISSTITSLTTSKQKRWLHRISNTLTHAYPEDEPVQDSPGSPSLTLRPPAHSAPLPPRLNCSESRHGVWTAFPFQITLLPCLTPAHIINELSALLLSFDAKFTNIFRSPSGLKGFVLGSVNRSLTHAENAGSGLKKKKKKLLLPSEICIPIVVEWTKCAC